MSTDETFDPIPLIAEELKLPKGGVAAVVKLLEGGSTVPFIARYRKEMTGGLDEVQIRAIEERRGYLVELDARRKTILESVESQGKLTPELAAKLRAATTKAELEDLYLPYKPKRRTRATIAREKGLEPLAERILRQPLDGDPAREALAFVSAEKGVADVAAALQGARDIVAERVAESAEVRAVAREVFLKEGRLVSTVAPDKAAERTKFEQYYDFQENVAEIPSHRFLAIRRGENEGVLRTKIDVDADAVVGRVTKLAKVERKSPWARELETAVADAYERLVAPSVSTDVHVQLKERSDVAAVEIFAENLRNLLLAAPLGTRSVIGVDPGLRTGCKCVAVDATGKFLENVTFYLTQGPRAEAQARELIVAFVKKHDPAAIGVGNGTGGRETETFVRTTLKEAGITGVIVVAVNEAGASVYSASDVARDEFPELDVTVRGAISIARRLQDPLSELVKIDPKSIGVGQYQHDVHQALLSKKLDDVVESCVNHVGVELNTASAPLLSHVAGIGPALAKKIVKHREAHGAFEGRKTLLKVSGLGPRTFEQAAGFLRVRGGEHPLDASAVHPERYALVEKIAQDLGVRLQELVGNPALADRIELRKYVGEGVGEPTLRDIVSELKKPGRDPRATFEPPKFRDDVTTVEDLKPGMEFEGIVTNVTAFGAFVDVGVHQDGLVHVSQLSNRFIRDPSEVVKAGDKLKVKVLDVDLARRRISLTAKTGEPTPRPTAESASPRRDDARPGSDRGRDTGRGEPRRDDRPRGAAPRAQGGPPSRGAPNNRGAEFKNNPFADLLKKK
ncbi:RNA-binding transcriptional accessory protein [Myxococcota bacterium]|nr:RNA-binding transcriptional accessory protein [Myxococcota bacterium]